MRKRTLFASMLALTLLTSAAPAVPTKADVGNEIALQLNGNQVRFEVSPMLVQNTLMVPLRDLSEALGVSVTWDDAQRTAAATKAERSIRLTVGSKEALRGSTAVTLDEGPVIADGKLLVPLRFFSESFDFNVYWDGLNRTVSIVDADKSLPTVGSLERMQELLKDSAASGSFVNGRLMKTAESAVAMDSKAVAAAPAAAGAAAGASQQAGAAPSYSGTNVQVEGVDEADVIKTDGTYIYQVNRNRVIVSKVYPADSMSVVSTVYWADPNFNPREIYVDEKHLVVVGNTFTPDQGIPVPQAGNKVPGSTNPDAPVSSPAVTSAAAAIQVEPVPEGGVSRKIAIWPGPRGRSTTKTMVFELGDRTNLKQIREAELEGNYISSRKVGDSLYVVTNKGMNYPIMLQNQTGPAEKQAAASAPAYRDSAAGNAFITIGFEDIRYFPKAVEPSYLLVGGINLGKQDQKMQVTSYLGSGQFVYASQKNLYITVNEYEPVNAAEPATPVIDPGIGNGQSSPMPLPRPIPMQSNSAVYKFGMDDGLVRYAGRGKVPGHPLNQFSMDEQDGYFRIATTSGEAWRNDEFTSKNNMYVLNEAMSITGKIEDIAPGERIYSVRYTGNRAYMVTFKQVDPLFVIDLKDPGAPKILGKLKIPGYSNYLHPYDENHIIGFGKDAVETASKNGNGGPESIAYYQGMKLAMFDVTDVENPKEMFKETIGGRGTDSELLYNHKALLFSKEKNLLAFPVRVMEVKNSSGGGKVEDAARYGEFTFQGAYVYKLDLEKGFQLRGKISHLSESDMQKAGRDWYGSDKNIERLLYIGDTLYSSSLSMLKANDLKDLHEIGTLSMPVWSPRKP